MTKAYLGSTNQVKIAAVKTVLKNYEVISYDVDSKVSCQPFSDDETIKGALNRAKQLPIDGLRIGLEAGVQEINQQLFLVNWGVLIDQEDNTYIAGGTRILLPLVVQQELYKKTKELAIIIDELYNTKDIKHHEGAIGLFTAGEVTRIDIFIHIVKLLYGQYKAKILGGKK